MRAFMRHISLAVAFYQLSALFGCAQTNRLRNNMSEAEFEKLRLEMVSVQIADRGVKDKQVLDAMRKVPRHLFVPAALKTMAYEDCPLAIGEGQTISQPYIVGLMTELAHVNSNSVVLEIGTGSGYQAAVLSLLVKKVCTIEFVEPLGRAARERLQAMRYDNVEVRIGDGYQGWPEPLEFDAILITAAINHAPPALLKQLKSKGRLVMPLGDAGDVQWLMIYERQPDGSIREEKSIPVQFVPFLGEGQRKRRE